MIQFLLLSVPLLAVVGTTAYFVGGILWLKAAVVAYLPSLLFIWFSYGSIRWAFTKPSKTFYSVIFSGMAIRFAVFFVLLLYIKSYTQLSIFVFVICFMIFYLLFQVQEVRLINRELRKNR